MDEPTTSKGITGGAETKTMMALRVTALIAVVAAVVSFGALRYVEHGIRGSLAQQQFALVQGIISEAAIFLALGISLATVVILVLVRKLAKCLTAPLATLARQVDVMEETGELLLPGSAGIPEIGRVADALNRMAGAAADHKKRESELLQEIARLEGSQAYLRESEESLHHLMKVMPVGVVLTDRDGGITFVNHWFVEHFGYTQAELPDLATWCSLAFPDPAYRSEISEILGAEVAESAEGTPVAPESVTVACRDGSLRHSIVNRRRAGNRRVIIFTDITERESHQSEILKSQKLESLGVLAGGIAHDFNNILTGILGNVTLAQVFLDPVHPASEPLANAEKAAVRAGELATQLLTFAKGGTPVKRVVEVGALIEEAVSLALRGSNVSGRIRIPSGLHAIEADEGQVSQVFHNIVLNAVQAMPGGGMLVVSAENVPLAEGNRQGLTPGDYIRITFADEGCGIPEEMLNKIFDPYFTTKPGGTGLGLASVHSIVKRHGGQLEVRSLVGRGTDFTCYLPSIGVSAPDAEAPEGNYLPERSGGGSILVMDDEKLVQTLAVQILLHLGYRATTCSNGEDAVALYERAARSGTPFSAAIMDLTIPGGMGGREAAQRILSVDKEAKLIVSSGYSNDPVMADYESYGFCAAIAKPYRVSELAAVLAGLGPRKERL